MRNEASPRGDASCLCGLSIQSGDGKLLRRAGNHLRGKELLGSLGEPDDTVGRIASPADYASATVLRDRADAVTSGIKRLIDRTWSFVV